MMTDMYQMIAMGTTILRMVVYGTPSVDAMMNGTIPITGGVIAAAVEAADSMDAASTGR